MFVIAPIKNTLPVIGPFATVEQAREYAKNFKVNYNIRLMREPDEQSS